MCVLSARLNETKQTGEDGREERYAVLVPGQEARASGEQDAEKRKSLFK